MSVTAEQVEQQVQAMFEAMLTDPARSAEFKRRLGIAAETVQSAPAPAPESDKSKVLLNDYTFRRIDKFTGAEGTWPEWSFNMLMTITQVDADLGTGLEELKKEVKPLTDDMFTTESSFDGYIDLDLSMC